VGWKLVRVLEATNSVEPVKSWQTQNRRSGVLGATWTISRQIGTLQVCFFQSERDARDSVTKDSYPRLKRQIIVCSRS